jgi:hypothetical protein
MKTVRFIILDTTRRRDRRGEILKEHTSRTANCLDYILSVANGRKFVNQTWAASGTSPSERGWLKWPESRVNLFPSTSRILQETWTTQHQSLNQTLDIT